jgi:hypothetical protein
MVKKLSRGRTKAKAIVTGVLAPASVDDSSGILHRNMTEIKEENLTPYFSIASDASNYGSSRMIPVAIQFWTPQIWYSKTSAWFFIPILNNLLGP